MRARLTKSTPRQRTDLEKLREDLASAFESLNSRFWASRSQREAYADVLKHLELWAGWER